MVKPEILESTPINLSELKEELARIKKRDSELNFRAKKTEEYVNSVSPLSGAKAKELFDKLMNLKIPRFKENHAHKFIDIMPVSIDDAKITKVIAIKMALLILARARMDTNCLKSAWVRVPTAAQRRLLERH